jgi:transposase
MAGKPKRMSQVKQILQLHKQGYKIKPIAKNLSISKNTVKSYLEKYRSSKLSLDTLLLFCAPQQRPKNAPLIIKDIQF